MDVRTHLRTSPSWVGQPVELGPDRAVAALDTTAEMAVDDRELVHGGFAFGLADYAAMLAVNDPNVVLGASEARFLKPVRAGQRMVATAQLEHSSGRKRVVQVSVSVGEVEVLTGTFTCFVLDRHVLDG